MLEVIVWVVVVVLVVGGFVLAVKAVKEAFRSM